MDFSRELKRLMNSCTQSAKTFGASERVREMKQLAMVIYFYFRIRHVYFPSISFYPSL